MCGIIGILGKNDVAPSILDALKRLEYRGYDSAGIATLNGDINTRRAKGKLVNLATELENAPLTGKSGIGHIRWATHGAPTVINAHPHATEKVAIVHNGIIENFKTLRDELSSKGHVFLTETDTEVVAYLITDFLQSGHTHREAVQFTLEKLEGAFALVILINGEKNLMYGAKKGSPLVLGYGDGEMFLGSDAIALANLTHKISYLEEGDCVELTREGATIKAANGDLVTRAITISSATGAILEKGNYQHFMQKEIFEQPIVVGETLGVYIDPLRGEVNLGDMPFDLETVGKITIIACGTSYYAAMVAKYWFEQIARVPVDVDIASEFRYRGAILEKGGLALFISQSGETADTLAALKYCKDRGQHIGVIVNVAESSMAREADVVLKTYAGPEIGVASTKAFTCQLAVIAAFAVATGKAKGNVTKSLEAEICQALSEVPSKMMKVLYHDAAIQKLALTIAKAQDVLYLGRGVYYPIAMEGALKLKEISYIHAEGYAAGEMKHGPIALIDENVPIIVIAPSGPLFDKTISNMHEVMARNGKVILISDKEGVQTQGEGTIATIEMPKVHKIVAPMLYALPVQLLSYHVAVHKGTDVDQPRNLAKSVTVE